MNWRTDKEDATQEYRKVLLKNEVGGAATQKRKARLRHEKDMSRENRGYVRKLLLLVEPGAGYTSESVSDWAFTQVPGCYLSGVSEAFNTVDSV